MSSEGPLWMRWLGEEKDLKGSQVKIKRHMKLASAKVLRPQREEKVGLLPPLTPLVFLQWQFWLCNETFFLGAHKHAYNFVSSFISTPLSLSPPPSLLSPLSLYKTAACIPRLACLFHSELPHPHWAPAWEGIRSAESQMLGLRGEPDSRSSPAKLGLCVTSMIPRSGSRKGSWEARGPSAFHRIQQCLRLSTFQGYLKPNPLGSAPSSAT